jgi:hypothetical protein
VFEVEVPGMSRSIELAVIGIAVNKPASITRASRADMRFLDWYFMIFPP